MKLSLPYGETFLEADIDWGRFLGVVDIADRPAAPSVDDAVAAALNHPIGLEKRLVDMVSAGDTCALLVSDSFRQTRADQILPILVDALNEGGIPDEDIVLVFATGTHRAPTPEEQRAILGPAIAERFHGRTLVHDPHDEDNLTFVATTPRGTPVFINRRVYECDRIIATGAVVLHYFAGFGGGRKAIVPGIAGVETIAHNHAMNLDPHRGRTNPAVRIGVLDGNPVAEDMLDAARLVNPDFIVNTVLNARANRRRLRR